MGILIVDQAADFSAAPVGHAGLYTSLSTGLLALHEIRRSNSKAINNAATVQANGSVIGAPTWSAASGAITQANSVLFGTRPQSGGMTFASIFKIKNGGGNLPIFGSSPGTSVTQGLVEMQHYNRRITFHAYSYAAPGTPPLASQTDITAFKDLTVTEDGTYELFFGVLEDAVSLRLRRAKDASTVTTTTARYFSFDNPKPFRTMIETGTAETQDISMFGAWSRVLTPAEMITFYAEMQQQFALLGLTI